MKPLEPFDITQPHSIDAMEERIGQLKEFVSPFETERAMLQRMIRAEKSPFKIGDVIRWQANGNRGDIHRGRVTDILKNGWLVKRLNKDGHLSIKDPQVVYTWQNPHK